MDKAYGPLFLDGKSQTNLEREDTVNTGVQFGDYR
jgi:hypothetical protein